MNHYELHSRISIDSEKDWDRIRANLTRTLLEQVDLRFADQPEADPKLKEEVIRRALEWSDQLLALAPPNLRLNGRPYDEYLASPEPTEEFDESLDRKIRSLAAQKELTQVQIAERRTRTPRDIRNLVEDLARRKAAAEWIPGPADLEVGGAGDEMQVDVVIPNKAALVSTLDETLGELASLSKTLPVQLERAEQARLAARDVANLPA